MAKQAQKLFRVGAAAHQLGLHPMTVRRWIKAGRIGVVQVGRRGTCSAFRNRTHRGQHAMGGWWCSMVGSVGMGKRMIWRPN